MNFYRKIGNKVISYVLRYDIVEININDIKCNKINRISKRNLIEHIRNGFIQKRYDTNEGTIVLDKNNYPIDGNHRVFLTKRYHTNTNVKVKKIRTGKLLFYLSIILFHKTMYKDISDDLFKTIVEFDKKIAK